MESIQWTDWYWYWYCINCIEEDFIVLFLCSSLCFVSFVMFCCFLHSITLVCLNWVSHDLQRPYYILRHLTLCLLDLTTNTQEMIDDDWWHSSFCWNWILLWSCWLLVLVGSIIQRSYQFFLRLVSRKSTSWSQAIAAEPTNSRNTRVMSRVSRPQQKNLEHKNNSTSILSLLLLAL